MREALLTSAEVRFIDREQVLEDLRRVAARARALHPEIRRVFLIGSLARGDWTAESDADLIVVDPTNETVISAVTHRSHADYSLYEGMRVKGMPEIVIARGKRIVQNGQFIGTPGAGQFLKRTNFSV